MCERDWFVLKKPDQFHQVEEACRDRTLKIVNKNNKNSYSVVQETDLDEECVLDSEIGETLESTDAVKD